MRTVKRRLILTIALVVALSLLVAWLLLARPSEKALGDKAGVPPQTARAATFDRAQPEIRVRREFRLEELMRFDSEAAPWLSGLIGKHPAADVRSGESARPPEQVASVSAAQKGGWTR